MNASIFIRAAMLLGVLLFGGVTWFVRRSGQVTTIEPARLSTLLWIGRGTWVLSMLTCLSLFGMLRNAGDESRARTLSLLGWSAGDAVALVGGVIWFLTGNSAWYFAGLVYFVLTLLSFPARRG